MKPRVRIHAIIVVAALICLLPLAGVRAGQFTTMAGYSLTYPDTWNAEPNVTSRDVFLRNYPGQQLPFGRMVPAGGASINIQTFPPYDNARFPQGRDDDSALDALIRRNTVITRTSPSGTQPARATSVNSVLNTRFVHTILHKERRTFLIIFDCNADDPHVEAYEQVLDNLIASITFTSGTPVVPNPTREVAERLVPTA